MIPLESRTRQGCTFLSYFFNIALEVLAVVIKEQKEIQRIHIAKEEVKLSLLENYMIIYISETKTSTRELQLINTLSDVAGYQINSKQSVQLLYTNDKEAGQKSEKHHLLQ